MDVVLDACTLINLINGQVIQKISSIPNYNVFVSDNLLDLEILNQSQKLYVEVLLSEGKIRLVGSTMTLSEFTLLKDQYDLGDGETECIAICKKSNLHIATDDRKARICAVKEIGQPRVVGSLYFLRELVRHEIISCEEAINAFNSMKQKGAYLPNKDRDYFCK